MSTRATLLLFLMVMLATEGCATVVIIQRSVPSLLDQWRGATIVSVPRDSRKPVTVKD
jgi:uncharacterized protein YceK